MADNQTFKFMSNKVVKDFSVIDNIRLADNYSHLVLREAFVESHAECRSCSLDYAEILPGQFVEVRIDGCSDVFLRRPISINDVVPEMREIHLLVRNAGVGTDALCRLRTGDVINMVLPLGKGFSINEGCKRPLLIGGGVGVAPLLYLGKCLKANGITPTFLLAAKTANDLLEIELFKRVGRVFLSTDDGSAGHCGLVTENPALNHEWDMFYCCGPVPMMKAIGHMALERGISCEVSLENVMACGLGACLCCVEDTVDGHVCVCKEGPVFDVRKLKW